MDQAKKGSRISVRELAIFAMLGTIMFCGDFLMEWAPNVHFVGVLVVIYTVVYRVRALIPIYLYVLLIGVYQGFGLWWIPYLYVWTALWGATMLLPRNMPKWLSVAAYMVIPALHGLLFGVLYAPFQALAFGLSWQGTLTWIAAGFPFDAIHGAGNFAAGTLVLPMVELLRRLEKKTDVRATRSLR